MYLRKFALNVTRLTMDVPKCSTATKETTKVQTKRTEGQG